MPANEPDRENRPPTPEARQPGPRRGIMWLLLLGGILAITFLLYNQSIPSQGKEKGTATLRAAIQDGRIAEFEYGVNWVRGRFSEQGATPGADSIQLKALPEEQVAALITFAEAHGLDPLGKEPSPFLRLLYTMFLPTLMVLLVVYFLIARQIRSASGNGGVFAFGKSRARRIDKDKPDTTFDDVAGIEEAKEEVREVIAFLKNPQRFARLGGRIPRGILLIGAPGTGKTLLAKAIAGEAQVPFFSISGSDFVEMFVGVGASRVRDLFKQAKESAPCIIFLDEIDAVGRHRGHGWGGGHDEREQTLNAILVEMDGFETNTGVILIAATNRPDVLDPALLRPGRFDRSVYIDMPDTKGREAILKVHSQRIKLKPDVNLSILARGTPGFNGAELEAIINESAIMATMRGKEAVELIDLEEARDKIRWGRRKTSRIMDDADKKVIAYHEAGHALVAKLLPEVEPLHKVTMIPRGMALGATMQLPETDRYTMSRNRALGDVKVLLAGRVSEQMFCGDITTGSADDIRRATDLVGKMIREWGMSEAIGPISFANSEERLYGGEVVVSRSFSEETAMAIDHEIRKVFADCQNELKALLEQHKDELVHIAEALLAYETLEALDVDDLLAGVDISTRKQDEMALERAEVEKAAEAMQSEEHEEPEQVSPVPAETHSVHSSPEEPHGSNRASE